MDTSIEILEKVQQKIQQALDPVFERLDNIEKRLSFFESYYNRVVKVFLEERSSTASSTSTSDPSSTSTASTSNTYSNPNTSTSDPSSTSNSNSAPREFISVGYVELRSSGQLSDIQDVQKKVIETKSQKISPNNSMKAFVNIVNKRIDDDPQLSVEPLQLAKYHHKNNLEGVKQVCSSYPNSTDWFAIQCKILYIIYNHIKNSSSRRTNETPDTLEETRKRLRLLEESEDNERQKQKQKNDENQSQLVNENEDEDSWRTMKEVLYEVKNNIKTATNVLSYIEGKQTSILEASAVLSYSLRENSRLKSVGEKVKRIQAVHVSCLFEKVVKRSWDDLIARMVKFTILFHINYLGKTPEETLPTGVTLDDMCKLTKNRHDTLGWELILPIHNKMVKSNLKTSDIENLSKEVSCPKKFTSHEKYLFHTEKNARLGIEKYKRLLKFIDVENFEDLTKEKANIDTD